MRNIVALKLIKTKNAAFIVDEVQDDVREKMGILFSRAIHLYAKRVPTVANPKGVMQYSDYFSSQVVRVCRKDKIVEERAVNEAENKDLPRAFDWSRS